MVKTKNGEPKVVNPVARLESVISQKKQSRLYHPKSTNATTRAKRKGTKAGKQFVKQPKNR